MERHSVLTAVDDSSGPEKRPPVFPKPAHGTGQLTSLILTDDPSIIVTTLTGS